MEEFRPIDGHPSYFISNLGRVMSRKRKIEKILAVHKNSQGYAEVTMFEHSRMCFFNVARGVLAAFEGYPAEPWRCFAYNRNGDRMDCRLENLEWMVCDIDETYDPRKSHRKGVLRPQVTKDKMTEAKLHQSPETIQKSVMTRKKNIELRGGYRKRKKEIPAILEMGNLEDLREIQSIHIRINGK